MGDSGKADKGKRESKKKAVNTPKEKKKMKRDKKNPAQTVISAKN